MCVCVCVCVCVYACVCMCASVNPNPLPLPFVFSSSLLLSSLLITSFSLSISYLLSPISHLHHLSFHCFLHLFPRVSALSRFGIMFVMTHDSIGLGEGDRANDPLLFIFISIHLLQCFYHSTVNFVCVCPVTFFCLSRFLFFILLICV